jgi:hypothetical protein
MLLIHPPLSVAQCVQQLSGKSWRGMGKTRGAYLTATFANTPGWGALGCPPPPPLTPAIDLGVGNEGVTHAFESGETGKFCRRKADVSNDNDLSKGPFPLFIDEKV